MTMLLNLVAVHVAACAPNLHILGVAADVQRLALGTLLAESTAAERLMVHAVQLLSDTSVFFKESLTAAQQGRANPLKPPRHLEGHTKGNHPACDAVATGARMNTVQDCMPAGTPAPQYAGHLQAAVTARAPVPSVLVKQ
ncbi:hypothetical protein CGC20_28845 [Leishmania donovani]|uniref:Uncharacterized protein n=1 Tax=Leishmania donovani TaxID=5661 RepID=A0A504XHL7_LEIDO|nr:hypothetical protein CGC20_28845 [Leishmania donovani]TPP48331.1 hypothetical protein CGC21_13405 [Leishmania donovani]